MSAEVWLPELVEARPVEPDALAASVAMAGIRDIFADSRGVRPLAGGGQVEGLHFRMDDGTVYGVDFFEPAPDRRRTDVRLWTLPAYGTGAEGHNEHTIALPFVKDGIPVAKVGPANATVDPTVRQYLPSKPRRRNVRTTAHHTHQIIEAKTILDSAADDNDPPEPTLVMIGGESYGGNVALVMSSSAIRDVYKHRLLHVEAVAPVFPEGLPWRKVLRYLGQLARNPATAVQECRELPASKLWDLLPTLPRGKAYAKTAAWVLPALLSNETGRLAQQIPQEQQVRIITFNGDGWGEGKIWGAFFSGHAGVVVEHVIGSHLSIINHGLGSQESLHNLGATIAQWAV